MGGVCGMCEWYVWVVGVVCVSGMYRRERVCKVILVCGMRKGKEQSGGSRMGSGEGREERELDGNGEREGREGRGEEGEREHFSHSLQITAYPGQV